MSRDKGNRAGPWLARWLAGRGYFPRAEAVANGRHGMDILNTPGVAFEVKTGVTWREEWLAQCRRNAGTSDLPVLIYLPPGVGEQNIASGQMILPVGIGMEVLRKAGYCD